MAIDLSEGKPVHVIFAPPLTPAQTQEFRAAFKTIGPSGPGCGPRINAQLAGDTTPGYKEGCFQSIDIVTGAIAPQVKAFLKAQGVSYTTEDLLPYYEERFKMDGHPDPKQLAEQYIADHNPEKYPMNDWKVSGSETGHNFDTLS